MNYKIPATKPTDFIVRLGTELALSSLSQRLAVEIIEEALKKKLTNGKDPSGLAAAALYFACIKNGERRNQLEVAKIAHVTEVTIRHRYKDLLISLGDTILNENFRK